MHPIDCPRPRAARLVPLAAALAAALVASLACATFPGAAAAQDGADARERAGTAAPPAPGDLTLDRIAAVVNEAVVLESDVAGEIDFVRRQSALEGQPLPDEPTLRARVRERLVDREVQRQHARRLGVSVDAQAVNRAIEDVARRNNLTVAQLRDTLRAQGLDYERYRANIEHEVLLQRLVQRDLAPGTRASEQEIDDFVDALENDVAERRRYRLSHLLAAVAPGAGEDARAAARARAEEAIRRLDAGEDFAALAAELSDGPRALEGGDLGARSLAELPGFIAGAVPGLDVGEVAGPIESDSGFHVIRLEERSEADPRVRRETLVRHVFVAGDDPRARRTIDAARDRILAGEPFASVAAALSEDPNSASDGGELPWFGPDEMPPELERVAAEQPVGRLGEPFATRFGWPVLEVRDRRERRVEDARVRVRAAGTIRASKIEREVDAWMRRLRDDSFVEVRGAQGS